MELNPYFQYLWMIQRKEDWLKEELLALNFEAVD